MIKKSIISVLFIGLIWGMFSFFGYLMKSNVKVQIVSNLSHDQWTNLSSSPEIQYRGKVQYQLRCYKCHGLYGEGGWRGSNLVDDEWLYGNSYQQIFNSTYYGIGSMKGYGKKMTLEDLQAITVYIKDSLGKSN